MKTIPTTYFCCTIANMRTMLLKSGLDGLVAVRASGAFAKTQPISLAKFIEVLEGNVTYIVAQCPQDIAFVTHVNWMNRLLIALRNPRALLGPSLHNSRNAVMLTVPCIDETCRQIKPGFVSSYPKKSKLFQQFSASLAETMKRRDNVLVSSDVATLLDQGYKIRIS